MAKFVLFLRGVNVGGVKVLMKDLATLLGEAGYGPVKTVLASGNAILDAPHGAAPELRAHCEQLLADYYGRPIPALAFSAAEVHELAADFPVPVPAAAAEFHRYLTLCASERDAQELYAARRPNSPMLRWWRCAPGACAGSAQRAKALKPRFRSLSPRRRASGSSPRAT
ncbi:DUF1697 domain-containing protein [Glutamicibacter sp. AOP3-A1-12]|uniref:DUF1697 domain-containing protein n=1 Tax=Glutamicibacter sp. AOP3-A1-12 TaxID=3457701 RepID=UPI0040344A21